METNINVRLKALGLSVVEVGEGCCDGCENQQYLAFDCDCYERCETFAAEVAKLESEGEQNMKSDLPARLVLSPDQHIVYDPDDDNRQVLHRLYGFDGKDLPTVAELVRRYNAHAAAVRLSNALDAYLKWRHNHVASAPESQQREVELLEAQGAFEKASKP